MLKRQRHLQHYLIKLGVEAELVPMLRAEIGALKGKLNATQDILVNQNSQHAFFYKQLKRMKSAEHRATTRDLQVHVLNDDFNAVCDENENLQLPVLRAVFNEACDERPPVSVTWLCEKHSSG